VKWNSDRDSIPRANRLFSTVAVWILLSTGERFIATYHTANGYWYPLREVHGPTDIYPDREVVGWLPLEPPPLPQATQEELLDQLADPSVPPLPADFSREDLYRDHD
jgi:hypothetical protein